LNKANTFTSLSNGTKRKVGEAVADFAMIRPSDTICVALSGGKDSLLLLAALARLRRVAPKPFALKACTLDPTGGELDLSPMEEFCGALDVPLRITRYPIYSIMRSRGEDSPCSFCANMRRGILCSMAQKEEGQALALGHHLDDALETALLNLFFAGRFAPLYPKIWMSRSRLWAIRPLIYLEERSIELETKRLNLPVIQFSCPFAEGNRRALIKQLVKELEERSRVSIKGNALGALKAIWKRSGLNHKPE
jgi:tRNA 2-thiocytidine biosynthesis protein TtcA